MTFNNRILDEALQALRKAHSKRKIPLWRDLEERLQRPKSKRVEVNIGEISGLTESGDLVIVPGKVLGGGQLPHKVAVGALAFSHGAITKIQAVKGVALLIPEFVERFPDGSKVILVGG